MAIANFLKSAIEFDQWFYRLFCFIKDEILDGLYLQIWLDLTEI